MAEEELHVLINEDVKHDAKYRWNVSHYEVAEAVHGLLAVGIGLRGLVLPVREARGSEPIQEGHYREVEQYEPIKDLEFSGSSTWYFVIDVPGFDYGEPVVDVLRYPSLTQRSGSFRLYGIGGLRSSGAYRCCRIPGIKNPLSKLRISAAEHLRPLVRSRPFLA